MAGAREYREMWCFGERGQPHVTVIIRAGAELIRVIKNEAGNEARKGERAGFFFP